jgi:hypothetical protein
MEKSPFEQFILENLYNLWKEYGTSKIKTYDAIMAEYDYKEKNIRKPLRKLVSAGLVDTDSTCAWLTQKGIRQMNAANPDAATAENQKESTSLRLEIRFLKNLEQAIGKSELSVPEREMWLTGLKQMGQNPVLLKAIEAALKTTML